MKINQSINFVLKCYEIIIDKSGRKLNFYNFVHFIINTDTNYERKQLKIHRWLYWNKIIIQLVQLADL